MLLHKYCNNVFIRRRRYATEVAIGDVKLGDDNPVRIQSMTNTSTSDVDATIHQSITLIDAGCEMVRITARNIEEAKVLGSIKKKLYTKGYKVPIIADIHYSPDVALIAAGIVEKVRINPGNYIDKNERKINWLKAPEAEFSNSLESIAEQLSPLLKICKENETAIRVGTNHGSLSPRILARFGNTPEGMVESALEFARIIKASGFEKLVLSMKSSNVKIMVQAYRMLISRMLAEDLHYPLHVGVTEAGCGIEGVIRSAAGIGALLADGIGDTIRVSLTGDPVNEIPVAKELVDYYAGNQCSCEKNSPFFVNPFRYERRLCKQVVNIGQHQLISIIIKKSDSYVFDENKSICNYENVRFVEIDKDILIEDDNKEIICKKDDILVLNINNDNNPGYQRYIFEILNKKNCDAPVALKMTFDNFSENNCIKAAAAFSSLLVDGLGDAIILEINNESDLNRAYEIADVILNAIGLRHTKAEFISCPTCGRTDYDICRVLDDVKKRTEHLSKLKIAVMGCMVNGPGEMADADFGCVGTTKNNVAIFYRGKLVFDKVNQYEVADKLIDLIKDTGNWQDI